MEPPEGGPEDKAPPSIVSIEPSPGSVGVPRSTGLTVTFSEKIDGESFRGRVLIFPAVEYSGIKAKGERLEIRFREQLPETTFSVVIMAGYSDQHNVKNERSDVFHFSTSSAIDTGSVSGRVLFKEKPDSTGVVHLIAILPADTIGDPASAEPSRIAFARQDGGFDFRALPTGGERFILWAFTDRNRDGRFSQKDEFAALAPDTITLDRDRPRVEGVAIDIIDPNEPGSIAGRINDETGLGMPPTARFDRLGEKVAFVARADTTGAYLVPAVPPGEYIFSAFIDVSGDSLAGNYIDPSDSTASLPEPSLSPPDTIVVSPGERTSVDPVTLKKEGGDGG
jgi:hypothetical protein